MLPKYKKIVENAVRVCLEISAARKIPFDLLSDVSETLSKDSSEWSLNWFWCFILFTSRNWFLLVGGQFNMFSNIYIFWVWDVVVFIYFRWRQKKYLHRSRIRVHILCALSLSPVQTAVLWEGQGILSTETQRQRRYVNYLLAFGFQWLVLFEDL